MLTIKKRTGVLLCIALGMVSCRSVQQGYLTPISSEEVSLGVVRLSKISSGKISGHNASAASQDVNYEQLICGYSQSANVCWGYARNLALSPDGKQLAYITERDGQNNISVQASNVTGIEEQRTSRNVMDGLCWGEDNQIYFSDNNDPNVFISSIDSKNSSSVLQITKGDVIDYDPILTEDKKLLFFTRWSATEGPSVWMTDLATNEIKECCKGFGPCPIPGTTSYYCVRNSASGRTEIWLNDYMAKSERVIMSDASHSFTHPVLSPDGKWLLVVANSMSNVTNAQNLDIFAVRPDGTGLTQLTYHPANDSSPVWAKDGRSIFFLSNRGTVTNDFNVWKMNFTLE